MEAIVIAIIFYIGWKLVKFMIRRAKEADWEEKTKSAVLRGITIKPVNTDQKFISSSYYPRDCESDSIGELLERCGEVGKAIPYYQAALSLNDKIGVKKKLKKLLSDQQNEMEL